jgi:hypothetical protein|tara:strand:- start:2723 stop:3901 length:1179 start_codon:yes stop_codon:yes gene_type:complete
MGSTHRDIIDLPQNHPSLCHCRVWCRETGQAGGQGGFEKGCPQKNIKHRPSKTFTEEEAELWNDPESTPPLCLFHARAEKKNGGLNFGYITEERPTHFSDNTPHGFHNRVGKKIPWKCNPPDYTKTHKEHQYRLRDDTSSRDLLRDKYEKIIGEKEKSVQHQITRRKIAEEHLRRKNRQFSEFVKTIYKMPWFMLLTFNRDEKRWYPMDPESDQVIQYFQEWRARLKEICAEKTKGYQRRKIIKEHPEFGNLNLNEMVYETIKKPMDLVWEDPDELDLRLKNESDDFDGKVEGECICRDLLFDIVNLSVQKEEDTEIAIENEVSMVLDDICLRVHHYSIVSQNILNLYKKKTGRTDAHKSARVRKRLYKKYLKNEKTDRLEYEKQIIVNNWM